MSQRYIGGLLYNPPGGFSGYFDGSGDYLTFPNNASMPFGTGSFTIEFWINGPLNNDKFILGGRSAIGGSLHITTGGVSSTAGALRYVGSSTITSGSVLITDGNWHHVAIVRNGSSDITIYVDGVPVGTGTDTTNYTGTGGTWVIGANDFNFPSSVGSNQLNAYLSNLRIVKAAVYTAAFTPPSGPLQAITNTFLLTCAYGTFRDGSTNNFTITVNGNTTVSAQNPFPQTQLPNPALGNAGNGVYTMSQYQALKQQNLWPAIDPYFDYVTLMLHGNGTNGAQNNTFLDSSTNNFTITRNGNTTQGTFTPYGSNWSNYFDGSTAWLNSSASSSLALSGNFTVEFWLYYTGTATNLTPGVLTDSGTGAISAFELNNGSTYLQIAGISANNTVNRTTLTGGAIGPNQWYHLAFVRNSNVITAYINGVAVPTTMTNSVTTGQLVQVGNGRSAVPSVSFLGYLSNYRIVSSAVYTSNFTPSTAPLTAITGTQMLTCQSNRFVDNSSNALTFTVNGSPSVQRFSPFNPTTPYAAGTIGGSGYFDGTGDYLGDIGTTSSFNFLHNTTALFTFECWVYLSSTAAEQYIFDNTNGTSSQTGCALSIVAGGALSLFITRGVTGVGNVTAYVTSTGTVPTNQWVHIAVTYDQSLSSNNAKFYINGAAAGSGSKTGNTPSSSNASNALRIGCAGAGAAAFITGYISNLRISNSIVYSSAFTPPTTPVTGGALLLNFTNGGIIDNAMMNNLETVGNAQISTSVSRFGGGSLAFDGTGDCLLVPNSENFNFGAGNWTIEFWVRFNTVGARQIIMSPGNSSGTNAPFYFELNNSLRLRFLIQTAATGQIFVDTSYTPNANQWYHLAGVRNGSTATFYVDGVAVGSVTPGANALTAITNQLVIGDYIGLGIPLNGYLDDVRFTKGYARYTGNFTPQRSQWQDQ